MSPVLMVHVSGGTVGLVSGAAAMSFRKGSRRHAIAGKIFVLSMLFMAAGATYLGIQHHETGNTLGGIFTAYLILTAWLTAQLLTAWLTAQRAEGTTSKFDWVALLIPLVLGLLTCYAGIEKLRIPGPPKDGVPVGMTLFLGSVQLLAAGGDVRMLLRGGLMGKARIVRHLWRMCFGLFIATGSFFLGPNNRPLRFLSAMGLRQRIFQAVLRQEVLILMAVLPLLFLVFWMVRVRLVKKLQFPMSQYRARKVSSAVA